MPRPKPPEKLLGRQVRMSDRQWIMFNELGGADWLRKLIEKKAPMPKQYYDKLLQEQNNDRTREANGAIPNRQ
jgi:hypothetical protein